MLRLLIEWLLKGLVVGLLNVLFGVLLGLVALPLFGAAAATASPGEHVYSVPTIVGTLLMLLFDAFVLWVAAKLVPGFRIKRFLAAFIGAIVLVLIHIAFSYLA